jgi:hypothetical protein
MRLNIIRERFVSPSGGQDGGTTAHPLGYVESKRLSWASLMVFCYVHSWCCDLKKEALAMNILHMI